MRKSTPRTQNAGPLSTVLGKLGTAGIQSATWSRELVLPWLSLAYLSHPDCLCLQVWLLPRIPAAGRNLFSRRGLVSEDRRGRETPLYGGDRGDSRRRAESWQSRKGMSQTGLWLVGKRCACFQLQLLPLQAKSLRQKNR